MISDIDKVLPINNALDDVPNTIYLYADFICTLFYLCIYITVMVEKYLQPY